MKEQNYAPNKKLGNVVALVIGVVFILLIEGCENSISDSVWVQQTTVTIHSKNVPNCLVAAVRSTPEISIDNTLTDPAIEIFVLSVPKRKNGKPFAAYIKYQEKSVVHIVFSGKSTKEDEEDRVYISPILAIITKNIERECTK